MVINGVNAAPNQSLKSQRDPFGTDGDSRRRFCRALLDGFSASDWNVRATNYRAAALRRRQLSAGPLERKN